MFTAFLLILALLLQKAKNAISAEESTATGVFHQVDYSSLIGTVDVNTLCTEFFKPEFKGKKLVLSGWVKSFPTGAT